MKNMIGGEFVIPKANQTQATLALLRLAKDGRIALPSRGSDSFAEALNFLGWWTAQEAADGAIHIVNAPDKFYPSDRALMAALAPFAEPGGWLVMEDQGWWLLLTVADGALKELRFQPEQVAALVHVAGLSGAGEPG